MSSDQDPGAEPTDSTKLSEGATPGTAGALDGAAGAGSVGAVGGPTGPAGGATADGDGDGAIPESPDLTFGPD